MGFGMRLLRKRLQMKLDLALRFRSRGSFDFMRCACVYLVLFFKQAFLGVHYLAETDGMG